MRLFLDTANIEEIREANRWGVLSGVTTNPTLVATVHGDPDAVWKEILAEVDGDVSLEVTTLHADEMYAQGLDLADGDRDVGVLRAGQVTPAALVVLRGDDAAHGLLEPLVHLRGRCHARDLGEPWPTVWHPGHPEDEPR